jgi:G3E family GTPase
MIGGFLGAGKTTAVVQLAHYLTQRGKQVGLISNDQSTGLVDTTLLRSRGFNVEEIAGGCFCCRFNSLAEAAAKLTVENRPDVFVAEPVGSCTDLVATVSYPLRRIYGDRFLVAPLSVLVDPVRAARVLGLADGRSFSSKVVYIYRKQLEEADFIIVNKCDTFDESLRGRLVERLADSFPRAEVMCCSARAGTGLNNWFDRLLATASADGPAMELDYERYAEGEALLGWLNCTVNLAADEPFDADALLMGLSSAIRDRLRGDGLEIAHLKMTLDSLQSAGSLSVVSVVGSEAEPDLRESLAERIGSGRLIINLRAEADPAVLHTVTQNALNQGVQRMKGLTADIEHLEHFRPAKPEPTHRISTPP